jgi:hypothetical protein
LLTVLAGLVYQIGNIVPVPFDLSKKARKIVNCLSISLLVLYYIFDTIILYYVGLFLLSAVLQSLRSFGKNDVSTTKKRLFRIIGFVFSAIIIKYIFAIIALFLLFISTEDSKSWIKLYKPKLKLINVIMIIHQMHYFSYVYFLFTILLQCLGNFNVALGIISTLGWLSYISVPHILRKEKFTTYCIIGHVYLSIVLVLLSINLHSYTLMIVLWVLTGFGGGTVFCISKIQKLSFPQKSKDLEFSENIGHIIGVSIGILLYIFFDSVKTIVCFSSICAFFTAVLIGINDKYRKKKRISYNVQE